MLQKRHFQMIANILREIDLSQDQRAQLARAFARELASTNPRFDKDRFLAACQKDAE